MLRNFDPQRSKAKDFEVKRRMFLHQLG